MKHEDLKSILFTMNVFGFKGNLTFFIPRFLFCCSHNMWDQQPMKTDYVALLLKECGNLINIRGDNNVNVYVTYNKLINDCM